MITGEPWGMANGRPVELYTLASGAGMTVTVSTFGAAVQSVWVPDRLGRSVNVALGFGSLQEYVENVAGSAAAFFGATIGRYANRIAGHSFVLDGTRYALVGNDGPGDEVTLHGGPGSYHTQVWDASAIGDAVRLTYVDPDGRNGFPGTVRNEVVYSVGRDNALRISYRAICDAPTVVNLTNHTYWNLAGEGSGEVYGQRLAINAEALQPVDGLGIPVGFAAVAGTPFDFRAMKPIGRDIGAGGSERLREQLSAAGGYDHNWVLRGAGYRLAAVVSEPASGIALWAYTDQPGLQFYTANHLTDDLIGTGGRSYGAGHGFALETQRHPDAPNHQGEPGWPAAVLRPGEEFVSRTTYRFTVADFGDRVRFF
ncbi:MAG: galactose mutarotase [Solirubrobacterales bacterium]|nr:galactose mutarotase [Solirubrobacterales bacterium]